MKMNNHGQTLVLFIIFIPVLLMLCAFVIDTGVVFKENNKLSSTTKIVLEEAMEKDLDDQRIKELFEENEIPTSDLKIQREESKITIKVDYRIDSIFAKMIGIKDYEIKINETIQKENDKYILKKN